eukprot:15459421-Alexandrium_andersonii.AAC.1
MLGCMPVCVAWLGQKVVWRSGFGHWPIGSFHQVASSTECVGELQTCECAHQHRTNRRTVLHAGPTYVHRVASACLHGSATSSNVLCPSQTTEVNATIVQCRAIVEDTTLCGMQACRVAWICGRRMLLLITLQMGHGKLLPST